MTTAGCQRPRDAATLSARRSTRTGGGGPPPPAPPPLPPPPPHGEKPRERAAGPSPPAAPAVTQVPASPRSTPAARGPVRYRKPGSSWVTVVVLAFAAVGVAAV